MKAREDTVNTFNDHLVLNLARQRVREHLAEAELRSSLRQLRALRRQPAKTPAPAATLPCPTC